MPSTAPNEADGRTFLTFSGRLRLARRVAAMVLALLACLPLHYGWRLAGRSSPWPRRFLAMAAFASGMRWEVSGTARTEPTLFLANHASWLDILLLAATSGASFVSKAEVGDWPVFGWMARLHNTVFVARDQRSAVHGQAEALRSALAGGRSVALFPEGTTDGGRETLPFRASLLAALFPPLPRVQVQPVAIDYGAAIGEIEWVGAESAKSNVTRLLARKGTTRVRIHFLAPVDPAAAGDRKILARRSREEITERLHPSGAVADRL